MSVHIHLISNMYPSAEHPAFGVFVKEMTEKLSWYGGDISISRKTVITRKPRSRIVKFFVYLSFYFRVLVRSFSPHIDLLYAHYVSHTALPVLLVSFLRPSLPIIINIHGSDVAKHSFLLDLLKPFSRMVLKRSRLVIMPSSRYAEIMTRDFGVPPEKLFVSPSGGIDIAIFHPLDQERCREHLRLSSPTVVGYIARFDQDKRWPFFFRTVAHLIRQGVDVAAIAVTNSEGLPRIKEMAKEAGVFEKVRFFGDVERKRLPVLYGAMDIFLFPSVRESLGLVGLEAMAGGVPGVSVDSVGVREYLNDEKNGFFARSDDDVDLAEKTLRYLSLPGELKQAMRETALQTALRFAAPRVSRELAAAIQSATALNNL